MQRSNTKLEILNKLEYTMSKAKKLFISFEFRYCLVLRNYNLGFMRHYLKGDE